MSSQREQYCSDFLHRLVAHRSVNQPNRPTGVEPFDVRSQSARPGWVMRAIKDDLRICRYRFEPPWPNGLGDAGRRDPQMLQCGCGSGGVDNLMRAGKRTIDRHPAEFELTAVRMDLYVDGFVLSHVVRSQSEFVRPILDHDRS